MKYAICSGGLRAIHSKQLPLKPNTIVPLGASSSPDDVFIVSVSKERVEYLCYPYHGCRACGCERDIFDDLCATACRTNAERYIAFAQSELGQKLDCASGMYIDLAEHLLNLLQGKNTLPVENLEDYERLRVKVRCESREVRNDPWYICEYYGGVTGLSNSEFSIHCARSDLNKMKQDQRIQVLEVSKERV